MNLKQNEGGALNILLIPLIISVMFFFGALGFGVWAFYSRSDYKNNSDRKSAAAVEVARKKLSAEKDNEFIEREKFPLEIYQGPAELGSINVSYPKTWSVYISTDGDAVFAFNPKAVFAGDNSANALKITIVNSPYNDVVSEYDSQIEDGKLKAVAFRLAKVPNVVGLRFDGEVEPEKIGTVVVLPLRDKTIKMANEAPDKISDFNNIILPNLSFTP